jgi:hypothetical protein
MRHKILSCLSFLFLSWTLLNATILEIATIQDVVQHVEEGTLVVFDIDNTLLECSQSLGSDQWFCSQLQALKEQGWKHQQALDHVLAIWTDIQHRTALRPVEAHTAKVVNSLQQAGYPLIALTTRSSNVAEATKKNLYASGIDLRQTAPLKETATLIHDGEETLYQEGILFTNNGHKGKALWAFLQRAQINPRKIVFINDKHSHLLPVEEISQLYGIEFVGLRYGGADARVKNFRREIADIQLEFYGKILTDEAAEAIWLSRQSASSQAK